MYGYRQTFPKPETEHSLASRCQSIESLTDRTTDEREDEFNRSIPLFSFLLGFFLRRQMIGGGEYDLGFGLRGKTCFNSFEHHSNEDWFDVTRYDTHTVIFSDQ